MSGAKHKPCWRSDTAKKRPKFNVLKFNVFTLVTCAANARAQIHAIYIFSNPMRGHKSMRGRHRGSSIIQQNFSPAKSVPVTC